MENNTSPKTSHFAHLHVHQGRRPWRKAERRTCAEISRGFSNQTTVAGLAAAIRPKKYGKTSWNMVPSGKLT
jgi:hypothetical protein